MNSYTHALTHEQVGKLRALLEELSFEFAPKEWTIFFAQKNKLSVAVYEKGPKVLVQGRGAEEFVQFELEPKVAYGSRVRRHGRSRPCRRYQRTRERRKTGRFSGDVTVWERTSNAQR